MPTEPPPCPPPSWGASPRAAAVRSPHGRPAAPAVRSHARSIRARARKGSGAAPEAAASRPSPAATAPATSAAQSRGRSAPLSARVPTTKWRGVDCAVQRPRDPAGGAQRAGLRSGDGGQPGRRLRLARLRGRREGVRQTMPPSSLPPHRTAAACQRMGLLSSSVPHVWMLP